VAAEFRNPVMLYSIGKDSSVMLHLARKAFWPALPPFPLLHIDTKWKFREMIAFRDRLVAELGLELRVYTNESARAEGINPFTHGSELYTDRMKTEALKQALDDGGYDVVFGGARRDEEKSRAKERIFSFRAPGHRWDPKAQRPELWNLLTPGLTPARRSVFSLFPIDQADIWQYIAQEKFHCTALFCSIAPVVWASNGLWWMTRAALEPAKHPSCGRSVHARLLSAYRSN
jgi:sulfate adenylyltransferase subunit 2